MTPDVERYVRQTLKAYGWTQEPVFHGYVEEYLWWKKKMEKRSPADWRGWLIITVCRVLIGMLRSSRRWRCSSASRLWYRLRKTFGKILKYVSDNPQKYNFHEANGKRSVVTAPVASVNDTLTICRAITTDWHIKSSWHLYCQLHSERRKALAKIVNMYN